MFPHYSKGVQELKKSIVRGPENQHLAVTPKGG